jgi:hypothetical protein
VLAEIEYLATVEHALVVEYLSVCCALGYELDAAEGGATCEQGMAAASAASLLAQDQMRRLKNVEGVLVAAGLEPQVGRAASLSSASVPELPLDPPSVAQLRLLVRRENDIARAVDERYQGLQSAVSSAHVFTGDLLEAAHGIIDAGSTHAQAVTGLVTAVGDPSPPDLLRAVRREPADTFEERLLDVSDRVYQQVVTAMGHWFRQLDSEAAWGFRELARDAMDALDAGNRVLVQRGLLPAFLL